MKIFLSFIIFSIIHSSVESIEKQNVLHYLIRKPLTSSAKPPLLILLHGVGSNEEDMFSFADRLPGKFLVVSARAPITLSPGSFAWFHVDLSTGKRIINSDEAENSRQLIIQFVNELKNEHPFDENNVFLIGFSQGAIMSYSVALTRPDLIKGIAIMSGRLLEEVKPKIASDTRINKLKIFISHGTQDNTLNIQFARDAKAFLSPKIDSIEYHEYSDGHTINSQMLSDLILWLGK
jgi:phospholipase/carboxylesterase